MRLTNQSLMMQSLVQYSHALYRAMWDAVNAGHVYSGSVDNWLVDTRLNCRSCDDVTVARCTVATWCEFDQALRNQAFKCGCGGVLTRDSALVKIPVAGGLTK